MLGTLKERLFAHSSEITKTKLTSKEVCTVDLYSFLEITRTRVYA